jgi:vacuolar-type H+-ATPase subunit E/Vma4
MQTLGSPASLIAAIREDAAAEAERIQESTASELASIRAEEASSNVAIADREERLAAARRENEERIAKQEWEARRAVIEQREAWIGRVVAKARERWGELDPARVAALVDEARAHLPEGAFQVDGCVVTVGNVSFDNSFEARSRRREPAWRNALSGMYTP